MGSLDIIRLIRSEIYRMGIFLQRIRPIVVTEDGKLPPTEPLSRGILGLLFTYTPIVNSTYTVHSDC